MMEMVTYRKFYREDQLNGVVEILKENKIRYLVLEDRESLDSLYGDKQFKKLYFIKIWKQDFEKVDQILLEESQKNLDSVESDHYLFSFTDDELFDLISRPDEWSEFDFLLAQKILGDRGLAVDATKIKALKEERIRELAKPDEDKRGWIIVGYIFALLGGLLGVFIGWHLSTFRKTLPNGEKVFGYTARDRRHGNRILVLGIVMFILAATAFFGRD